MTQALTGSGSASAAISCFAVLMGAAVFAACGGVVDPCEPDPCHGRGRCIVEGDAAVCACRAPFAGERCEVCAAGYSGADCRPDDDQRPPACAAGEVTERCTCGADVVTDGFCCGGIVSSAACLPAACAEGGVAGPCLCGADVITEGFCCGGVVTIAACQPPACGEGEVGGALAEPCLCGADVVTDGYCCGGVASSTACQSPAACGEGAVTESCVCGSSVVTSGYCCGGVASSTACQPPAACGEGAVSSRCTCGSSVVTSGYCCGGVASSTACQPPAACGEGAVTSRCTCGSSVVTSGYCCGGVASSAACQPPAACGEGAVTSRCTCGSSVVTSGYCCGGVASSTACQPPAACGEGAITSRCACGSSVVTSGYCCGGVASSTACQPPAACGEGAVTSRCTCGSSVVTSGYCCGGVASSTACQPAACGEGAVTSRCTCGPSVVTSGYCCGGAARTGACPVVSRLPGFGPLALACSNGIQDDFEDAVDCGGACPACPPPSGRPTLYISSSRGNDSWSGTLPEPNPAQTDGPWQTLQKLQGAWPNIGPGHFILLRRGDRWAPATLAANGLIQPPKDTAGTASAPITIGAYGTGARPVLSTVNLQGKYAFHSSGLSYFRIEDIEFRGTVAFNATSSPGVHHVRLRRVVWDGAAPGDASGDNIRFTTTPMTETAPETWAISPLHDIEFGFCLLQNNQVNDILNFNTPSGNIWIHHNEFYNSLREALDFGGGDDIVIEQNIVSGGREANGIKVQPQMHTVDDLVVRDNLIVHVGVQPYHYPLVIYNSRRAKIYGNTIVGNNISASGSPAVIFGWMPSAPVYFSGLGTWGFDNADIHDNIFVGWMTFALPDGAHITFRDGSNFTYIQTPFWQRNLFRNNVFYNPKGSRAFQVVRYVAPTAVWYDAGAPGFYATDVHTVYEDILSSEFTTRWTANANVTGDVWGNPLFVNGSWASPTSYGDYHLQPGSPATGKGCYPQ